MIQQEILDHKFWSGSSRNATQGKAILIVLFPRGIVYYSFSHCKFWFVVVFTLEKYEPGNYRLIYNFQFRKYSKYFSPVLSTQFLKFLQKSLVETRWRWWWDWGWWWWFRRRYWRWNRWLRKPWHPWCGVCWRRGNYRQRYYKPFSFSLLLNFELPLGH